MSTNEEDAELRICRGVIPETNATAKQNHAI